MRFSRALFCADAQAEPLPTPSSASRYCQQTKIFLPFNPSNFCLLVLADGGGCSFGFLVVDYSCTSEC